MEYDIVRISQYKVLKSSCRYNTWCVSDVLDLWYKTKKDCIEGPIERGEFDYPS